MLLSTRSTKTTIFWSRCNTIFGIIALLILTVSVVAVGYVVLNGPNHHNHTPQRTPIINIEAESSTESSRTDSEPILSPNAIPPSSYYKADGADDLMTSMPLLNGESCEDSPTNCGFNQYSGYLLTANNKEIHYWFFEADTVDDPMTKPLFFWTNGGPGCSGMLGLLTEQGPWRVISTKGELSVEYNPFTWILEVNMVFLEQPFGVGFSVVSEGDEPVVGDVNSAEDMDAVIRNFITKFPQFENHPIYTTGESYGGHYIPMTAYRILTNNEAGAMPYINYQGFFLGNPYTDYYENFYGFIEALYGHGLVKGKQYDLYRRYCWNNATAVDDNIICDLVYVGAYYSAYNADYYAIDWPQCPFEVDWTSANEYQLSAHLHFKALKSMKRILNEPDYESLNLKIPKQKLIAFHSKIDGIFNDERDGDMEQLEDIKSIKKSKSGSKSNTASKLKAESTIFSVTKESDDEYVPCLERHMKLYLRLEEVQEALHVKRYKWGMCALKVWKYWPDADWYSYMQPFYEDIIENYSEKYNLTLAIYSGDDDAACSTSGEQYWLNRWKNYVRDDSTNWLPWKSDDLQLGGYHTIYHNRNNMDFNALHLITVRSAGHMVPTTQPGRSLTVLRKFLFELSDYPTAKGKGGW